MIAVFFLNLNIYVGAPLFMCFATGVETAVSTVTDPPPTADSGMTASLNHFVFKSS